MISELDLVSQGLRFAVVWVEVPTPFRTSHPAVRVQGPKDRPELVETLKAAVHERSATLADLDAARRSVWERWKADGKPVAVRESKDKSGATVRHEHLPYGVCETCSESVVVVRGGVVMVEGIQCHLCILARLSVLGVR